VRCSDALSWGDKGVVKALQRPVELVLPVANAVREGAEVHGGNAEKLKS
jgi:hypothetical protein